MLKHKIKKLLNKFVLVIEDQFECAILKDVDACKYNIHEHFFI